MKWPADSNPPVVLPSDDAALLDQIRPEGRPSAWRGLFADDCALRRISGERVVLFGGGAALLFEVAHPLVAEGVARFSNYRSDPFGRLRRTLDAVNAMAFGDLEAALAASRSLEVGHARVHGVLEQPVGRFAAGTGFHGRDPQLVRWVWATLCYTALQVYGLFVAPVERALREDYYADHRVLARAVGVPGDLVPETWQDFEAYFASVLAGDAAEISDVARDIAATIVDPPPGMDVTGGRVRVITAGLLTERLRAGFGLTWDESTKGRFDRLIASVQGLRAERS